MKGKERGKGKCKEIKSGEMQEKEGNFNKMRGRYKTENESESKLKDMRENKGTLQNGLKEMKGSDRK